MVARPRTDDEGVAGVEVVDRPLIFVASAAVQHGRQFVEVVIVGGAERLLVADVIDRHGRLTAGHEEKVISIEMHHAVYDY